MILLDTNVVSEIGKPRPDANVVSWYGRQRRTDLFLPSVVVAEMCYGAERIRIRDNTRRYQDALAELLDDGFGDRILAFARVEAEICGHIRALRESRGRPVSQPDAMIAAICIAHGATLATRNVADFQGIDVKTVNPFEAA